MNQSTQNYKVWSFANMLLVHYMLLDVEVGNHFRNTQWITQSRCMFSRGNWQECIRNIMTKLILGCFTSFITIVWSNVVQDLLSKWVIYWWKERRMSETIQLLWQKIDMGLRYWNSIQDLPKISCIHRMHGIINGE